MTTLLLTAFEPYGNWQTNASWLVLMELTKDLPEIPEITTRLYPVDFGEVRRKLEEDLTADFDFAIHLGQAPGSTQLALESIAVNVADQPDGASDEYRTLVADGPTAYRSSLPLPRWAAELRAAGIPAAVSFHAGTYLCNGIYYFSQHLARQRGLKTRSMFLHLPIDLSQATGEQRRTPALPRELSVRGLKLIVNRLAEFE